MVYYFSDRYFAFFDYQVSHGQLLLRSSKSAECENNIDIIFFGVKYTQLFVFLWGLSIENIDELKSNIFNSRLLAEHFNSDTGRVFLLKSKEEDFYIAASYFKVYENQLEFIETSLGVLQ